MAKPEHLKIVEKGRKAWNKWRKKNPDERPDLCQAELMEMDLRDANLTGTDLSEANLMGSDLSFPHRAADREQSLLDWAYGLGAVSGH